MAVQMKNPFVTLWEVTALPDIDEAIFPAHYMRPHVNVASHKHANKMRFRINVKFQL